jgi:hypothetical protein
MGFRVFREEVWRELAFGFLVGEEERSEERGVEKRRMIL